MKLQMLLLRIKKPQKYKNENLEWKTFPKKDVAFLELGTISHGGEECKVGYDASIIIDTSKVLRNISHIEELDTQARLNWFKNDYPDVEPLFFAEKVVRDLGKPDDHDKNVMVISARALEWSNNDKN